MTSGEFHSSIRSSRTFLEDCGLLRSVMSLHSHEPSVNFRHLALDAATTYRELYLCGIEFADYNFLLNDYSFFQFSYTVHNQFRLAFYPNPFTNLASSYSAEVEQAVDDGVLSFEEYAQFISEQPCDVRIPVIRFELHSAAYAELDHPTAHLHIGLHTENRWPVSKVLTPRVFALFVGKMYYSQEWRDAGFDPHARGGFLNAFDRQYCAEKITCSALGDSMFSTKERGQLHIS